jgi:reactive intermediate/imine deaminase
VHALPAQRTGHESRVKHAISSPGAPKAIGPYSPAIRAGQLLFVSGQVPIDPATGNMITGGIADQTRRVLDNIGELLLAAGRSFGDVARTTVFLADMNDFSAMNESRSTSSQYTSKAGRAGRAGGENFLSSLPAYPAPPALPALSTPITPSTPRTALITFSRCLRSLISTVMSMRAR